MTLTFDDLPVGDYLLMVEVDWNDPARIENFVISAYGIEDVFFGGDIADKLHVSDFLAQVYRAGAISDELKGQDRSEVSPGLVCYRKYTDEGYFYLIFDNTGHDTRYEVSLLFKPGNNIELFYPADRSPEHRLKIGPGESVVFIGRQGRLNQGCSLPYSISTKVVA